MKKIIVLLLAMAFVGLESVMAQSVQVSGRVISAEDGVSLPGVSVVIQGTTTGVISNLEGEYLIPAAPADATLVFSFVGMQTQEVSVQGRSRIDIQMLTELHSLEEVMVVAYGTAKKASYTGSAEMVKTKQIEQRTVGSITKAIEGAVAGVQTTSGGGQPGANNAIRIRGYGSIYASSAPLYVVDGVPFDGQLNSINPNDISSISILKDAAAASLYGSRAANGVVIITTKKGSSGDAVIQFKGTWGISGRAYPNYELVNQAEYMELAYESRKNELGDANAALNSYWNSFGGEAYNPFNIPTNQLIDPSTGKVSSTAKLKWNDNWIDEALADNPVRQEYQFSVNGGTDKLQYLMSLGYLNEEGLANNTLFERYNGRLSLDNQVKEWIKTGLSASFAQTAQNYLTNEGSYMNNIWYSAASMGPVYPVYLRESSTGNYILDDDGNRQFDYGPTRPYSANFNSIATLYADKRKLNFNNLNGRAYVDFGTKREDLDFLNDFKFSVNLGVNYENGDRLLYYNPQFGDQAAVGGLGRRSSLKNTSFTLNELLTWNRSFGKSNFDVLVGHEYYHLDRSTMLAEKTGYVLPDVTELSNAVTPTDIQSWKDNYNVESYLSRINYNYDEKYYLSASFRTDGSSRFHQDNRWGNFWSVGASWRVDRESFLDEVSWIDNLTLKSSYGTQGNDMLIDLDGNDIYYAWQSFYDTTYPNGIMGGVWKVSVENRELKWEKSENFNIGFESRLFNRVTLAAEYYLKKTFDLLLIRPLGTSLGYDGYWDNVGNMRNQGFDITLGVDIFRNDRFQWNLTTMASTVKNEITYLSDGVDQIVRGSTILKVGEPINSFYVPKYVRIDPETGQREYELTEGGVTVDYNEAASNRFISGSRIPDLYGSITNEFRYAGFDLNVMMTYSIGGKVLDYLYMGFMDMRNRGQALHTDMLNRWQQPGDVTNVPKMRFGQQQTTSTQYLLDASYLSLKNITLGYTLPLSWVSKAKIQQLRVFATADNVYTFTSMKGMDPQSNFSGSTDYSYVPIRVISLGLDLKF